MKQILMIEVSARGGEARRGCSPLGQLTDELLESDLLVMATPMWNFGIPSAANKGIFIPTTRIVCTSTACRRGACSVRTVPDQWNWTTFRIPLPFRHAAHTQCRQTAEVAALGLGAGSRHVRGNQCLVRKAAWGPVILRDV